ncbi:CPBP family intramembrane glutamic endopeptidase [Paenibacillus turpanensis]|uniref:CPBP family intramembrane glutamic endopeptidase n=1 Tax=Paenibacillus turpanensis TaxID=2689078 RepID=UPI00140A1CD0|nr:type II CAAX endopeptidase family protein [Paenibacillus turpanensis]
MTALRMFIAITLGLAAIVYTFIFAAGGISPTVDRVMLMLIPTIGAISAAWIQRKNLKGFGLKWGKLRYWLVGAVVPILSLVLVYLPVWILGRGTFSPAQLTDKSGLSLPMTLLILMTVMFIFNLLAALAEEIGWRGFLPEELSKTLSYPAVCLRIALVWAVYHYPLLLFGDYNNGGPLLYNLICFTLMITGWTFIAVWLRMRSGSVWPAAIFHAVHNLFIQGIFDPLTVNTPFSGYITSEFGIGIGIVYACIGLFLYKNYQKHKPSYLLSKASASSPRISA